MHPAMSGFGALVMYGVAIYGGCTAQWAPLLIGAFWALLFTVVTVVFWNG